ncbi:MAG: hypothetical protein KJ882_01495, partial [Proteobacteria bacterium]|nr:hypothetical protein [Pseudomonadota bacterium]
PNALIHAAYITAGVGLFYKKGWGRYFAIFVNSLSVLTGIIWLLNYFYFDAQDISPLSKGLSDLLIAAPIFYYLFRKDIKELFSESTTSLCILGLILFLYSMNQHSNNMIISTFWNIMVIVGLAITGYGARQLRKASTLFQTMHD